MALNIQPEHMHAAKGKKETDKRLRASDETKEVEVLDMAMTQPNESEQDVDVKGEMLFTIFENETEHFPIAKIKIQDTNTSYEEKEIVIKGHFIHLQESTPYCFFGTLKNHPKFGTQF